MTGNKQDQIIFLTGKEKALRTLFSEANFGYLALGFSEDNGFVNETSTTSNGFQELTEPTYKRIKLTPQSETIKNDNNDKVSITLMADMDVDNVIKTTSINQLAIVDSSSKTDANTVFYCASTFPEFPKSEQTALSFSLEMVL